MADSGYAERREYTTTGGGWRLQAYDVIPSEDKAKCAHDVSTFLVYISKV